MAKTLSVRYAYAVYPGVLVNLSSSNLADTYIFIRNYISHISYNKKKTFTKYVTDKTNATIFHVR